MTTGASGNQLKLRLFLEGIEVPVIGSQVQMNLNAPATASIQVVPTDKIMELKPRTMVHLFFWDYTKDFPDGGERNEEEFRRYLEHVNNQQDSVDPAVRLDNYKLLFGGEVVGLVMSKSAVGRQAVLQCADWSTYWDTSYQTFISYSPGGNFLGDRSSVWAGGNNLFHNILSSHSGVMSSYLRKRPRSPGLDHIKGLMGGIIALLERMGGVPNHVAGINDYFTIAELKNHLMQQITAEQNDNTSQRLFSSKQFSAWLNSRTTHLGELVTFRDMLKLLFHWIYYEVVPVSTPYYVPAVSPSSREVVRTVNIKDTRDLNEFQKRVVIRLIRKSKKFDGSAGVRLTMARQLNTNEAQEAKEIKTALEKLLEGGGKTFKRKFIQPGGGESTVASEPSIFTGPLTKRARKAVKNAITKTEAIEGLFSINRRPVTVTKRDDEGNPEVAVAQEPPNALTLTSVLGLGPKPDNPTQMRRVVPHSPASQFLQNQNRWAELTRALRKILGVKGQRFKRRRTVKEGGKVDRLQTQIFRPDCFFVPPPRCNVLFPDQYTQFQFNRNFLREVTRLRLTTGLQFISGKGAGFFTPSNFAPNLRDIKQLARRQGNRGIRTLLPWEKHTGILPKFEHISEINYFANRRQKKLDRNIKGQANDYAQRAANFNFIKYRFAPRSLTINAKFDPFFAPGFPSLVIDKPFIIDPEMVNQALLEAGIENIDNFGLTDFINNIGTLAKFFKAPTQYLGMPATVSHVVDQRGGTTSTTMTHARTHRITDDDFLGIMSTEVTRKKNTSIRTTVLDAEELLARGDYKNLRFLIDATPQNIIEQMSQGLPQDDNEEGREALENRDPTDFLGRRPVNTPQLASLSQLAPVLSTTSEAAEVLVGSSSVEIRRAITPEDEDFNRLPGTTQFARLRGGTQLTQLKGTRTQITEPRPYGKIRPGSRGPKRGQVVHVQVLGDSVLEVSAADLTKFAHSRRAQRRLRRLSRRRGTPDSFFLWRRAVIHEEVTSNRVVKKVPIEEALRPPWFSPLYSNIFIGPEIYQKFFGTGSIVDQALFITPEGEAFATGREDREEILGQLRQADGDPVKISQILEENQAKVISEVPDIETAVDALAFIYGEVRRQGLDVQQFVANYTSRPIATMRDIFGSLDLNYEVNGSILEKTQGDAGFHSTAVAPFGELLGLVDNPDQELPRLRRRGRKFPISKALDPRPERRKKVEEYAEEVSSTRGSLGAGLLG